MFPNNGYKVNGVQVKSHVSGAKKITIKNFSLNKPKSDENFYQEQWTKLEDTVKAIYSSTPIQYRLEDLYRAVENVCTFGMAQSLYNDIKELFENYVKVNVNQFLRVGVGSEEFLRLMSTFWETYCFQNLMIRGIFLFMDRNFILSNAQVKTTWDVSLELFREVILCHANETCDVHKRVTDGILALIEEERAGNAVDRQLLRSLVRMLVDLGTYKTRFEPVFLNSSTALYTAEGQRLIDELSAPAYLRLVERRLVEEEARVLHYLDPSTRRELVLLVERYLLEAHAAQILDRGLDNMLESTSWEELRLLYSLLQRVHEGIQMLAHGLARYVRKAGSQIVQNPENDPDKDKEMVNQLLDFKETMDRVVEDCFGQRARFLHQLQHSFETVVNARQNKPAEYIAKYIDSKLRSGNKEASEEELDKRLDKIMVLFRYIHGKDVFEAFYKKDLAKRLLLGKSASNDSEKSMLSKLKQECGAGYTSKLEGMFKDIELSHDINLAFKEHLTAHASEIPESCSSLDMTLNILTMGFWPTYQVTQPILPPYMQQLQQIFNDFYTKKHSGRKLVFIPSLGTCTVVAHFSGKGTGRKELMLSLYQSLCVLLFNKLGADEPLSFQQIEERTSIGDKELRHTLQSLAVGKNQRVLLKEPMSKEINDDDLFRYNPNFRHKLMKIKFNQLQLKETKEEQQETTERVFADRQYQVDAAIVRIMKMRKALQHSVLITELYDQLKFPIKPVDLKKRIESLIDRDYMKRDKGDSSLYHYVA